LVVIVPLVVAHVTAWSQPSRGWTLVRNWNWACAGKVTWTGTITTWQLKASHNNGNNGIISQPPITYSILYIAVRDVRGPAGPLPPTRRATNPSAPETVGYNLQLRDKWLTEQSC